MTTPGALIGLLGFAAIAAALGTPTRARGERMGWGPFVELSTRWARFWGLPVPILLAVGLIESGARPTMIENEDPRAVSRGGSWGLYGMTLKTAEGLFRDHPELAQLPAAHAWDGSAKSLHDPELNAMLSSFYLARLYRMFGAHGPLWVIAAYQQGEGNVAHVLARGGGLENLNPKGRQYVADAQHALATLAARGAA